jgi:inosine/xanthosine triphosphatase
VLVALGSTRAPKVEALRRALAAAAAREPRLRAAEVVSREVAHDAPAMPLSLRHLLDGSRQRALAVLEAVRGEGRGADLGVGLEGGLDVREEDRRRRGFLMSWAYVTDGRRGAFGCGGAIEVPEAVLGRVVDQGEELSAVMDALVGQDDTRSRQGAWGVLTGGLIDRTRSFEVALVNAMAPFYMQETYA